MFLSFLFSPHKLYNDFKKQNLSFTVQQGLYVLQLYCMCCVHLDLEPCERLIYGSVKADSAAKDLVNTGK